MANKKSVKPKEPTELERAIESVSKHHLWGELFHHVHFIADTALECEVKVFSNGQIKYRPQVKRVSSDWQGVIIIAMLFIYLSLIKKVMDKPAHQAALVQAIKFFFICGGSANQLPQSICLKPEIWQDLSNKSNEALMDYFEENAKKPDVEKFSLCSDKYEDYLFTEEQLTYWSGQKVDYAAVLASCLKNNLKKTFDLIAKNNSTASTLPEWVVGAKNDLLKFFPLVGVVCAKFSLVFDEDICNRGKVQCGAINVATKEIYLNPKFFKIWVNEPYLKQVCTWVLSHLALHFVLQHRTRGIGRDRWIWNLACDANVNSTLKQMQVGMEPSSQNIFWQEDFMSCSADSIYDKLIANPKLIKKAQTLRGNDMVDIMGDETEVYAAMYDPVVAQNLLQLGWSMQSGRGSVPSGLEEEIKVLLAPVIDWRVGLANWLVDHLPQESAKKSWVRASRRESSDPDLPKARMVPEVLEEHQKTFCVILDTSASMMRQYLGKCLGVICAYAQEQGVKTIRMVYADAQAYDVGWMDVEDMQHKVKIMGRGGTVLQNAVDIIELNKEIPKTAPILILTDSFIDEMAVKREHAYVIPKGTRLPFSSKAPIFYIE